MLSFCLYLFFFFKQKTAYEMRISDWSSDVCSSDLHDAAQVYPPATQRAAQRCYRQHLRRADGYASPMHVYVSRPLPPSQSVRCVHAPAESPALHDDLKDRKSVV